MKKIMFSDRYGLTQAVLDGKKTMTRRIIPIGLYNQTDWKAVEEGDYEAVVDGNGDYHDIRCCGRYQIGETVAIAQAYNTLRWPSVPGIDWNAIVDEVTHAKGWKNKMFVKAKYMPYRIRITGIKVEKLQDISIEDCEKEGIIHVNWRQYLKQDIDDFSPQPYKDHNIWTLPIFEESFLDSWAEQKQGEFAAVSPDIAFAVLIDNISGKGTWIRNPWVFAYEFELIKYM